MAHSRWSPCQFLNKVWEQWEARSIWYHFYNVFGMTRSRIEPTTSHSQGNRSTTEPALWSALYRFLSDLQSAAVKLGRESSVRLRNCCGEVWQGVYRFLLDLQSAAVKLGRESTDLCQTYNLPRWSWFLSDLQSAAVKLGRESVRLTICCCEVGQGVVALLLPHDVGHHVDVVGEGGHTQPLHHHIWQVVGIQHQVLLTVLQQILIVTALILPHCLHCKWNNAYLRYLTTLWLPVKWASVLQQNHNIKCTMF